MSHRKKYIPKKGISTRLAHRRSVAANVNAKVRENTGAAIRMETTTSKRWRRHWRQLLLPAAVFHMLMLVLAPANATHKTMCVHACVRVYFHDH